MICALCRNQMKDYSPVLNRFEIDESHYAVICTDCIDKFLRWQRETMAKLFPTKAAKKMHGNG